MLPAVRATRAGDRVVADHDRQHREAGDVRRLVGEVLARVGNAQERPLHARRRLLRHRRASVHDVTLRRGALLDGVRQLVRDQLLPAGAVRLELVAPEEDVLPTVNALASSAELCCAAASSV